MPHLYDKKFRDVLKIVTNLQYFSNVYHNIFFKKKWKNEWMDEFTYFSDKHTNQSHQKLCPKKMFLASTKILNW